MLSNRRLVVGSRGGRQELPTPCAACVAAPLQAEGRCYVGERFAAWGCEDWVDDQGRRVGRGGAEQGVDRLDVEPEERAPAGVGVAMVDPEAGGPVLVAYVDPPAPFVPAEIEGPQGVLPMPDAGPLFGAHCLKCGRAWRDHGLEGCDK